MSEVYGCVSEVYGCVRVRFLCASEVSVCE